MHKGIALLVTLGLVLGLSTFVWAQGIDLQFDDQPLGAALRALQQAYGVQYNLPGELANKRVTVHQTVNSVAAAVQALAAAAGVRAIPDPNTGSFLFRAAQAPGAPGTTAAPANPWAGTAPAAGGMGPVPPTRPGMPSIPPSMPGTAPGAAPGAFPGTPGATAGQPGMLTTPYGTVLDPKDLTLRVLELNYLNPELVAMLFGGFAVYDISSTGGYGGYGGGGYGSSGYGYGSSGYGSSGYGGGRSSRSSRSGDYYGGSSYGYETGRSSSRSLSSSRNY